ncbi:hypothetical protein M409DRAFT_20271 [Zasmidium cellare ATCC 36951]|uniref:F-box domain-containing protein n=1 Tax=Zasmidium cellare ATCC 36951 TaxID=1080233 RepID=A0A6A6CRF3_ZASCE|nr:uncharacterized protein M409DRAFT_20271 [Zasmidium cellare ATCC 36951]KAF2169857.1 hypothetical protein M409DRAFT_20271 [Zasmidium cellare ATCC 36951]
MEGEDWRESSEARPSSSEDFYAQDIPMHHQPPPEWNGVAEASDVDDDSSEMDLSSPSRPATPEPQPQPMPDAVAANTLAGTKRKLSDSDNADSPASLLAAERFKKRKVYMARAQHQPVAPPTAGMPVEIWQRVFSQYLSPIMLARCLRVCKSFSQYLTAVPAQPPVAKKNQGKVQPVESESIWTQSRKNYFTTLPRPLNGLSELQMLQLLGGRRCQFCDKQSVQTPATSVYTAGPGPDGVRVIWPFRVRSCGQCLEDRMLKASPLLFSSYTAGLTSGQDIQVLPNPDYAPLRNGVTHGFRSQDHHFATESLRLLANIPANLRFSKMYYKPELDAIKDEAELAKTLGEGAADEWRKGLVAKGKEAMADCARWEKWELNMRAGTDLAQVLREYDLSSFPRLVQDAQSRSAGVNGTQPPVAANGTTHPLPQPVHVHGNTAGLPQAPLQHYPQPHFTQHSMPFAQPFPHFQHQPQQHHPRAGRSLQEAEQARQSRKADIERRCRELEPPLEPNVLQHIDSFQAAMQIALPMTDDAWEILKPKLLEKREAAEWVEHERASQLAVLQAAMPLNSADEIIPKPAKETYDREYEQAQEPLRKTLGEYADDFINGRWNAGKLVENSNAPVFAIHVLLHVNQRYTEDKQLGLLPRFEPPKRKDNGKQGTPPLEPFLSLDNMKWVYDNKVRPLTDVHKRELFLCPGCTKERNPKWFAFEGLIQHYGAKHTTAFSKGNIVVHWQTAQWPEDPPFHTNPGQWLAVDRRPSDYKSHGRARHTPQANHEGPFAAPNPAPQPADNQYHAAHNGYSASSHSRPFASPASHAGQNGYFYSQPAQIQAQPVADISHDAQITKLSNDAREIWDALDGVKNILECIRVQTVIHHAAVRYVEYFQQQPPNLDLLTDALATNTVMRPLKNAHGLACKSCVAAQPNGTGNHSSYWTRVQGARKYNTSSLITHFKLMHQAQYQARYADWTKDMIELPEGHVVSELLRTPGMDDSKLALIAVAFPKAFPNPLPKIGLVTEDATEATNDDNPARSLIERLARKSQASQKKKKGGQPSNGAAGRSVSQEPLPEPREDEYDPRRPMFVQPKSQAPDPSQFDTDAGKARVPSVPPPAGINFTPETLAALQGIQQRQAEPALGRQSRSPSVGRPSDVATSAPGGQPDISAILAALTGQTPAQAGNAQTSSTNRPASSSYQPYVEPPSRPGYEITGTHQSESRRSSGRHENAHQASNDPLAALQAALSQNSRQFDQNQRNTYVEARPEPTPRYQYGYDGDRQFAQQPAHAPTYREPPVQYVQMPEREYASYSHQYERSAAPNPIYVDQYGRPLELIPIDSAPAPVQYAPNPYEQQQYVRRHEPTVYTTLPPGAHPQPIYDDRRDDRRPVYYEPVSHAGNGVRYAYDDARASVPRS